MLRITLYLIPVLVSIHQQILLVNLALLHAQLENFCKVFVAVVMVLKPRNVKLVNFVVVINMILCLALFPLTGFVRIVFRLVLQANMLLVLVGLG